MLKSIVIGNLGADAEVKNLNGRECVTFRVAHSVNFTASDGTERNETIWVDCIGTNLKNVVEHLKKGQQVYVEGNSSLRVYSSKQDRCMKAGITVHVESLQLIGGKSDLVPRQLIDISTGDLHNVSKIYQVADMIGKVQLGTVMELQDVKGNGYLLDNLGYVLPKPADNQ